MNYTIWDVRAWKPIQLADSARRMAESNEAFEDQLDTMLRAADTASWSWTGTGAEAAFQRIEAEHAAGRKIAGTVEQLVGALRDGAERLHSVRNNAIAKIDAARAEWLSVDDGSWTVSQDLLHRVNATPERDEILEFHKQSVAAARSQLVDEDRAVSSTIDMAVDEVVATGRDAAAGLRYTPPTLADLTAGDVSAILGSAEFTAWMRDHPDAAKRLLDGTVDAGLLPASANLYKDFLSGYWKRESFERSGIDPDNWDPSRGADHNRDTIIKAYEYYGDLFLDNPDLQWAGMANMIGPSFAGGFFDLDSFKTVASALGEIPGNDALNVIGGMTAAELKFYETTFLSMQKEIFEDQASMHEAYLFAGVGEMERMREADLIDVDTLRAWRDIDTGVREGNQSLINDGNKQLLNREQMDIIADDYELMRARPVTGGAMTYLMTTVGAPSIPDAKTYAQHDPLVIETGYLPDIIPGKGTLIPDRMDIATPLPGGNIADKHQRWDLVENDTLPRFVDLLENDPARARGIIASDFAPRMEEQRLTNHVDDIIKRSAAGWGVVFHR